MEHINIITKKPYAKTTQTILRDIAAKKGFKSTVWMTFIQAGEKHRTIKPGEKPIECIKPFTGAFSYRGPAKYYIYNLDQTVSTPVELRKYKKVKSNPQQLSFINQLV